MQQTKLQGLYPAASEALVACYVSTSIRELKSAKTAASWSCEDTVCYPCQLSRQIGSPTSPRRFAGRTVAPASVEGMLFASDRVLANILNVHGIRLGARSSELAPRIRNKPRVAVGIKEPASEAWFVATSRQDPMHCKKQGHESSANRGPLSNIESMRASPRDVPRG